MNRLTEDFFSSKCTLELANSLLGKLFFRKVNHYKLTGIITETEAYTQEDEACHAFNGKRTKRTEVMFLPAGHLYVYFTYGMHYCVNITAEKEGRGCAVLIRSVMPVEGVEIIKKNRIKCREEKNLTNGPAKFSQAFKLTLKDNGMNLCKLESNTCIFDINIRPEKIHTSPRIGISRAKELLWRFYIDKPK